MNLKLLSLFAALAGTAGTALASTHVGISFQIGVPAPIVVRRAPPRHVVEVVAASPGAGYVWVAGHYTWTGAEWAWVPGAWVMPPQPGTIWIAGRWDAATQNWVAGHWEMRPVVGAAVVAGPPAVVIRTGPPPLRYEHHGHRPGRNHVWIGGYWGWQGGRYVWVTGHWAVPPHRRAVWGQPRWERRGDTWVFVEGRGR